jgi:hypothetical protein
MTPDSSFLLLSSCMTRYATDRAELGSERCQSFHHTFILSQGIGAENSTQLEITGNTLSINGDLAAGL